ncbi:hypothetical protein VUR80DRAFT_3140 [Thermomyces stellatus]
MKLLPGWSKHGTAFCTFHGCFPRGVRFQPSRCTGFIHTTYWENTCSKAARFPLVPATPFDTPMLPRVAPDPPPVHLPTSCTLPRFHPSFLSNGSIPRSSGLLPVWLAVRHQQALLGSDSGSLPYPARALSKWNDSTGGALKVFGTRRSGPGKERSPQRAPQHLCHAPWAFLHWRPSVPLIQWREWTPLSGRDRFLVLREGGERMEWAGISSFSGYRRSLSRLTCHEQVALGPGSDLYRHLSPKPSRCRPRVDDESSVYPGID